MLIKHKYGAKRQLSIKKRENVYLRHYNGPQTFIEYSNDL